LAKQFSKSVLVDWARKGNAKEDQDKKFVARSQQIHPKIYAVVTYSFPIGNENGMNLKRAS